MVRNLIAGLLVLSALRPAAAALPDTAACAAVAGDAEASLAQSAGLLAFIHGYPMVDLLKQRFNETHRVRPDQPVAAPDNILAIYPGLVTPATQGQLRGPNADTLYVNAWIDVREGPVLISVPAVANRYYTLGLVDFLGRAQNVGTRTNGGRAQTYALIGPAGGTAPAGAEVVRLGSNRAWLLGRILAANPADLPAARALAQQIRLSGPHGAPVMAAEPANPMASLEFFRWHQDGLAELPPDAGEAGLMAMLARAGLGRDAPAFDPATLSPAQALGLGCALGIGPRLLAERGFRPTRVQNGWMLNTSVGNPGRDYLLRAELARGGYVNAPEEAIYPATLTDAAGQRLSGAHRYRLRFAPGQLPPADGFWSITPYESTTGRLVENSARRYSVGDRTAGLVRDADGGLSLILSAEPVGQGRNWLPVPAGPFHVVARLYLPRAEAIDGRYALPAIERMQPQ